MVQFLKYCAVKNTLIWKKKDEAVVLLNTDIHMPYHSISHEYLRIANSQGALIICSFSLPQPLLQMAVPSRYSQKAT